MPPSRPQRRFWLAVCFSLLAHATALVVVVPLYALARAVRDLVRSDNETLRISLVLAVLLHVVILLPAAQWLVELDEDLATDERMRVELWSESAEAVEEERTPEQELAEYQPEEPIPEGEVVQTPSPDRRKPEVKPRFLAEHDSRADEESRSRVRLPGESSAASKTSTEGDGEDRETMPGGMRAEMHGVAPLPSDLAPAEGGDRAAEVRAPPSLMDINLQPSRQAMASAVAGSGLDNLDGVIDADHTALNTAGWKYAAFFNRVKRRVEQYWHPDVEYRQHDPYGNVYGFRDRITVLLVVLRPDGTLKKLYIMDPSGAPFLDEEAYDAVRLAAPFPNIPPGLMDKRDGLVKFTFHFIVEVGSQPVFRMRRYR